MKKHIPQIASGAGVVLLVVSLVWWFQTFGLKLDYIKCLAVSDGICRISGISGLLGGNPYNSAVFWVALVCLVAGIGLKKFGKF